MSCRTEQQSKGRSWLPPLLVALIAVVAYANSFGGGFIFDDQMRIVSDTSSRSLCGSVLGSTRPLVGLSLFLNYRLGGLNPVDYHAFNLVVHVVAGLLLYGVVSRTLKRPGIPACCAQRSDFLAGVTSAVWMVHPLQTESVTYIIQRAESMMGMFYLLALYCVLRSVESKSEHRWQTAGIAACALGMACKPVMVTAPLVILLYDRAFIAGSTRTALRERPGLYRGLAATWIIPAALLSAPNESAATAGFGADIISPLSYLATQPGVILWYLRLAFLPRPLCLDYAWPSAAGLWGVAVPSVMLVLLIAVTAWLCLRAPRAGFAPLWFLVILVPSSSIIPLADYAAEHRMYLSLAGVAAGSVTGFWYAVAVPSFRRQGLCRTGWLCSLAALTVVGVLAVGTHARNRAYSSEIVAWRDVVGKRPGNLRARAALVSALLGEQRFDEAAGQARQFIQEVASAGVPGDIDRLPGAAVGAYYYATAHDQLGRALLGLGRPGEAILQFAEALKLEPNRKHTHHNRAVALVRRDRDDEAMEDLRAALVIDPRFGAARALMGVVLARSGRYEAALKQYDLAVRLAPGFLPARQELAWLLATCPEKELRNGQRAVELAVVVCGATGYGSYRSIDVLAAGLAARGDFDQAVRMAGMALELARQDGARRDCDAIRKRSDLYTKRIGFTAGTTVGKRKQP